MKVLAVYSTEQLLGGGEVSFTLSLRAIQSAGCSVLAMVPARGPLYDHLLEQQIVPEVACQQSLRRGLNFRHLIRPRPDWLEIARRFEPDLIHANSVRAALYAQAVARSIGIPCVLHARIADRDRLADLFLLRTLGAIICTSETVRRRFPAFAARAQLFVLPNAVDVERFRTPGPSFQEKRGAWLGDGQVLVGIVGRLSPKKGQIHAIRAAPFVIHKHPEIRFVFVGEEDPQCPGYRDELLRTVRDRHLDRHFVFAGFEPDMPSAYHALDFVVFPSLSEGFGRVIIEAGAAGKAVLAFDIDAAKELLAEFSPLLVAAEDESKLAAGILSLIERPDVRAELGARLQRLVETRFGVDRHRDGLLAIYRELVSLRRH